MLFSPRVIGIAGGTCSGKSLLARGLADALGARCTHVHSDNYYLDLPEADRGDPDAYNFDEPSALDLDRLCADVAGLKAGAKVQGPTYDFATHRRRPETLTLLPREVILVEGILILSHPGLRALFDLSLFVRVPEDVRLARRLARDVTERQRTRASILAQWRATVAPMHALWVEPSAAEADHILDGTLPPEAVLAEGLRWVGEG